MSNYEVYFALGTDTWGRRLETRTVVKAETKDEAIEKALAKVPGLTREGITGVGTA